jgi:hypothetical protein
MNLSQRIIYIKMVRMIVNGGGGLSNKAWLCVNNVSTTKNITYRYIYDAKHLINILCIFGLLLLVGNN